MGLPRIAVALIFGLVPIGAFALKFNVDATTAFVFIQIGHGTMTEYGLFGPPAGQVDEVSFTLPAGVVPGDGTPVVGTPTIPVAVLGYSGGGPPPGTNYTVTMNSSVPLMNSNGDTLPFDEISWTTQDGDLPGGVFDQSAQQPLVTVNQNGKKARGIVDYLTFTYANDAIYPPGTYTGRVVYTIAHL